MEGAPMLDTTTFIGLDVHARSIKAVSLDVMTGEVRAATFGYDAGAVAEWVRSVDPRARCVYESGVTGFDLQKRLSGLGVDCVVGAVSKMIKPSADRRRKNDRNDAEFLARMLSVGNVVEVWVPDDECEAARDLTRALEDARDDLSRSKQRLSKFLLRHGLVFDERTPTGRRKGNWTRAHWSWIESIRFAERADNDVLAYLRRQHPTGPLGGRDVRPCAGARSAARSGRASIVARDGPGLTISTVMDVLVWLVV